MSSVLISSLIKELKLEFKQTFSTEISLNDFDFQAFIVEPQINKTISEIDKLPKNIILKERIDSWIEDIEEIISNTKINRKRKAYNKLKLALLSFINKIIPEMESESNSNLIQNKKVKKHYQNKEKHFTKAETILIIKYLQKNLFIIPNIDDTDLMRAFNILTGFSYEKLRQNNSITKKDIEDLIKSKESFDKVIKFFNDCAQQIGQIKKEIYNTK